MNTKKTSLFENGLIWFGAAVSVAEIMTGTYFAPLGLGKGIFAILLGHIIGCVMLFFAGALGAKTGKNAMETVKMSFGSIGSHFFAVLNVIQLVGWTGIMIYDGAISASAIAGIDKAIWAVVIGALIILWIVIGVSNLGRLNVIAMAALFVLTIVMSFVIFSGETVVAYVGDNISFGAAVELSVAMPLSWLPLISDYTSKAEKPIKSAAVSSVVYGIVSVWMYFIGMGAAMFTSEGDVALIMLKSGLGTAGLVIIILSTVTTTFLDAYSAGISGMSISEKLNSRWIAVLAVVVGGVGAILLPMANITEFLYFIGSVFAPMIAIQITDFFIIKKDCASRRISIENIIVWLIGFIIYRLLMRVDFALGSTLPDMLITGIVCVAVNKKISLKRH